MPRDLGRSSLLLFVATWGSTALGMLASIVVARALGAAAVGTIAYGLGVVGLAMAALLPGFGQAHLKRLAEGQDIGRCVGTMAAIQAALALSLAAVVTATWPLWRAAAGEPDVAVVVVLMLAAQVAGNLADAPLRVFIAREWVVAHGAILLGGRLLRLALTVAIVTWAPRITLVAATFALEAVLTGVAALALLVARHGVRLRPPTRESVLSYWRYARPFLVTTPIAMLQDSADRFVVGRWGGLAAAGYYHVARALWEALGSVLSPPATFMFTRLSALYARRSEPGDREARRLFLSGLDRVLFVTTPLAFLFWAFAEPLVAGLYGAGFTPAVPAVRILVAASVVAALVNPYIFVLYALDVVDRFVRLNLGRLVVYLVLLAALVAPLGPLGPGVMPAPAGAAVARLLLVAFPAWVYWRWTRQLAGVPLHERAALYLGGFGLMVLVYHAVLAVAGGGPGGIALGATAALAADAALLRATHPDLRDHLRYVTALLSPRRLAAFVRDRGRDDGASRE